MILLLVPSDVLKFEIKTKGGTKIDLRSLILYFDKIALSTLHDEHGFHLFRSVLFHMLLCIS